jgi:hypothetical protein
MPTCWRTQARFSGVIMSGAVGTVLTSHFRCHEAFVGAVELDSILDVRLPLAFPANSPQISSIRAIISDGFTLSTSASLDTVRRVGLYTPRSMRLT